MIGIVILNYQNWTDTRRCIESIHKNPPKSAYQIILVDNASKNTPDYDLHALIRRYGVLWIRNKENRGYNTGNNAGIAKALEIGCDYILISNSDVRYFPGSIQRLADDLKRHPKAGIAAPKIVDRHGKVQQSCYCRRMGLQEKYLLCTKANLFFRKKYRSYFGIGKHSEKTRRTYAVLGCCFLMDRKCAQAVTPFDTHPFLYEEELMLGIRMEQAGFDTIYCPKAAVCHLHGGSTHNQKAEAFMHFVCSELYYCMAYLKAPGWKVLPLYAYRTLLYLLRCARWEEFRRGWKEYLHGTLAEWKQFF
ncbi:MAG: glycosyltransferase family 2 protein [Eubacterium sp.]|nr:glycosyltransferase family 2 protein [Eubacterium sp.]